ncbi:ATP1B4 [Bugula neritina]|uniref:ATP1B4 n=1 Tax=Bugula neritina TaxID=10212 RepID=A0A7J7J4V7_BUGNE|nr:ATP1B4 [Bugula neritina]
MYDNSLEKKLKLEKSIADNLVTVTVFIRVRTEPPSQKEGISGLCQTINQFFINSYDAEKKELWGRNYIRWLQLIGFYICFYAGLACFFSAVWFTWFRVILNADDPIYSGEDGMAWTPGYEPAEWTSENGNFIDCTEGRTDPDIEKVCEFKLDYIRPCVYEDDYGWWEGEPCIILKLNRINNWEPENYESIDEVPEEIRDVWKPDVITVKCFGTDPVTNESLADIAYYPQQGWSFDYFPFVGQQGYKSPLVAVQLFNLPHRALLFITCRAYTKNMIHHPVYGLGQTRFEIISD